MGIGQAIFAAFSSTGTHAPAPLTDPTKWFVLILFGVAQMGIPYVLFGIGLKTVSPQEAGILTLIEPVLNPLWAYASVGEVPSAPTAIGGGVLLTVLGLRYLPIRRPKFIPPSSPEGTG
jgi:drug/metabolite transporter (DMT)-like permease